MHPADAVVLVAYLAGIVAFGAYLGRQQRTVKDYFVSGRQVPGWAIMGSIVATETSTVTFISIPGFAFAGNYTFLQLVIGYLLGRIVVSAILIPAYFRGDLLTAYALLGSRFGTATKKLASLVFMATRSLADGFRLFATGLVVAYLFGGANDPVILIASIVVVGAATVFYTYHGGMTAVIWTDVMQLVVYLAGAIVAAVILLHRISGGWAEVSAAATAARKFQIFDFTFDLTKGYTFWSGVIGGMFLTTATHGTDQLMVQRYLSAKSVRNARVALLWSGAVVFVQFVLFLIIGTLLWVFYTQHAPAEMQAFTVNGRVATDRIFPAFIVAHLPAGVVGLVMAAILAAAMSTLSSSLNSSAAAAMGDFLLPSRGDRMSDRQKVSMSRWLTAAFGLAQIFAALAALRLSTRVVDEVLGLASFTNGMVLGLFLLGTLTRDVRQRGALIGVTAGVAVMLAVKLGTAINWQWYVLIGSMVTFVVGIVANRLERA